MKKKIVYISAGVLIFILLFVISQIIILKKAHGSFENYYAFRGCSELIEKTSDYGICKTNSGQTIKIVKIEDKWYLDGDGPGIW